MNSLFTTPEFISIVCGFAVLVFSYFLVRHLNKKTEEQRHSH